MNQNNKILDHLRTHGTITPLEAIKKYSILRLAARIYDLERQGYDISHRLISYKTRLGKRVKYSLYRLVKE